MSENLFEGADFESEAGAAALRRALNALRSMHQRALDFGAAGHSRCALEGARRHRPQPCTCCPTCMLLGVAMVQARRRRLENRSLPWELFLAKIAINPGQSTPQWVTEGAQLAAPQLGLPAKPRRIRDSAGLREWLATRLPDEQSVVVACHIVGEAAHLGWRKWLDGDERPFNWGWIASNAVRQMEKDGHWDGRDIDADDARAVILDILQKLDELPPSVQSTVRLLVSSHMAGDVSAHALIAPSDRQGRPAPADHETASRLPSSIEAVAEIVSSACLKAKRPDDFSGLTPDARRKALVRTLRNVLLAELRDRGAYELAVLGHELVAKVIDVAATTTMFELAQAGVARAAAKRRIGSDACLRALIRMYHAAWGVELAEGDAALSALLADIRSRLPLGGDW